MNANPTRFPPLPNRLAEGDLPAPYRALLSMARAGKDAVGMGVSLGISAQSVVYRISLMRAALPDGSVPPITPYSGSSRSADPAVFAGPFNCRRCGRVFKSVDRRINRYCKSCKASLSRLEAAGGMDEHALCL